MKHNKELDDHISRTVDAFLGSGPLDSLTLTLDGMGVNSALQYRVLRKIGYEKLTKLKRINIISGSTYAFICFMAYHEGNLIPTQKDLETWDTTHIRLSRIYPFFTALKISVNLVTKTNTFSIPHERLSDVLKYLIGNKESESVFFNKYPNTVLWFYDSNSKKLVNTIDEDLKNLSFSEAIQGATSVPMIFQPFKIGKRKLSDPVYCPLRSELYRTIRSDTSPHLISNPIRDGKDKSISYLKPHNHKNGKSMLAKDFIKFLMAFRNNEINTAIKHGLFYSSDQNS